MTRFEAKRNWLGVLAAIVVAFVLAAALPVAAKDGKRRLKTTHHPQHVLESVDVGARTVNMAGEVFRVPEDARLFDHEGRRIHLRELKVEGVGRMVEFRVKSSKARRGSRSLKRVEILDGAFDLP